MAHTARNGWLCYPHLHFGVYASEEELYDSLRRRTIPITFDDVPGGMPREGETYIVGEAPDPR